jgi:hypothetical protein
VYSSFDIAISDMINLINFICERYLELTGVLGFWGFGVLVVLVLLVVFLLVLFFLVVN